MTLKVKDLPDQFLLRKATNKPLDEGIYQQFQHVLESPRLRRTTTVVDPALDTFVHPETPLQRQKSHISQGSKQKIGEAIQSLEAGEHEDQPHNYLRLKTQLAPEALKEIMYMDNSDPITSEEISEKVFGHDYKMIPSLAKVTNLGVQRQPTSKRPPSGINSVKQSNRSQEENKEQAVEVNNYVSGVLRDQLNGIKQNILTDQERDEIKRLAYKQEENIRILVDQIKDLQQEKAGIQRQQHTTEKLQDETMKQMEIEQIKDILMQQETKFKKKESQVKKRILKLQQDLQDEKNRFRYEEPEPDNPDELKDGVTYDIAGQRPLQRHDGDPQKPGHEYETFKPVNFATVHVFDEDGTYQSHIKDTDDQQENLDQNDGERKDYDQVMHENFQYEQTMCKAQMQKMVHHTGELMFSRAAMRHYHAKNINQVNDPKSLFNLADTGIAHVDQEPTDIINQTINGGYNIARDMQEEAYDQYVNEKRDEYIWLGEAQPSGTIENDQMLIRQIIDTQNRQQLGLIDYTKGKEVYNKYEEDYGAIDLVNGEGSQHSSFMYEQQQQIYNKIERKDYANSMKVQRFGLAKISGLMHMPAQGFQKSRQPSLAMAGQSSIISTMVRQSIEEMRQYPTLEARKVEIINKLYEEAQTALQQEEASSYYSETGKGHMSEGHNCQSESNYQKHQDSIVIPIREMNTSNTKKGFVSNKREIIQEESKQYSRKSSQLRNIQHADVISESVVLTTERQSSKGAEKPFNTFKPKSGTSNLFVNKLATNSNSVAILPPLRESRKNFFQRIGSAISRESEKMKRSLSQVGIKI